MESYKELEDNLEKLEEFALEDIEKISPLSDGGQDTCEHDAENLEEPQIEFSSCSCVSHCGGNFSYANDCECTGGCGANYSATTPCGCVGSCGSSVSSH